MEENNKKNMSASVLIKYPEHSLRTMMWKEPTSLNGSPVPLSRSCDDESLEMSIAQTGVKIPVIISRSGFVVDGIRRIQAAYRFNPDMEIPFHICSENDVESVIINSNTQVVSLNKFQRIFRIYGIISDRVDKLVEASENRKNSNLKHSPSSIMQDCTIGEVPNVQRVNEAVKIFGVEVFRLADLASLLNCSERWLNYCRGVYLAIANKANSRPLDEVQLMAHRFVFLDTVPVERIASAIAGYDSNRTDIDAPEEISFKQMFTKVDKALDTLLERINKESYVKSEHLDEVENQLERFALKLNPRLQEVLAKKLRQARTITSSKE